MTEANTITIAMSTPIAATRVTMPAGRGAVSATFGVERDAVTAARTRR
jgi:hypothetical protein